MPFWARAGRSAADRAARRHTETMAGVERRLQRILGQGYGLCCAFAMAKAVISLVLFVLETKVMDRAAGRLLLLGFRPGEVATHEAGTAPRMATNLPCVGQC